MTYMTMFQLQLMLSSFTKRCTICWTN